MINKLGSEKYGTSVMKESEVELYLDACLANGRTPQDSKKHMRIIDTLLFAERLERSVGVFTRKTAAGFYRKNSGFYNTLNGILEGAVKGAFE